DHPGRRADGGARLAERPRRDGRPEAARARARTRGGDRHARQPHARLRRPHGEDGRRPRRLRRAAPDSRRSSGMKRTTLFVIAAIVTIAAINYGLLAARHDANPAPTSVPPSGRRSVAVVAGPGRVEALSEEVRVSAQVGGRLQAVLVDENDRVEAGQTIAIIENDDYRARVASAEATLRLREAEARRVHNGARDQERRDAAAAMREADAVLASMTADVERKRGLLKELVISQAELDKAEETYGVARAKADSARERLSLVEAGSREEEIARADADVALARAALDEARAVLEKTYVRAPIDALVFRRHRQAGES